MIHIKTNKQKFLTTLFFCLFFIGGFSLLNINKVYAAETLGTCQFTSTPDGLITSDDIYKNVSDAKCTEICTTFKAKCSWKSNDASVFSQGKIVGTPEDEICPGVSFTSPTSWINCFLLIILRFLGLILSAAATLFNWILEPANMAAVIDNAVIYQTWAMVRDTLNIAFILVLLFSAFSTVFQVDKYSYKKLLLTLVLMALLVNFSYPIARFIIDFSNSMMYYLLNTLGLGNFNSVFVNIARNSQLGKIIYQTAAANTAYLLASVIFTWIFAITILIIAGLFVIRIVALALLIIFSSLAFTGSIIPFMSSYSSKWWDNLFKYAFFGPVMVFMLMVATKMMNSINDSSWGNMQTIAQGQSADPGIVAALAFFSIPIIILWGGIMFAQSMSLAMSGAVIGRGQKFMKWAPNSIAKATGVPGGFKKAANYYGQKGAPGFLGKIPGLRGSEKTEASEAWVAAKLGVKGAKEQDVKKRAEEYKKNNETKNSLIKQAQKGDAAAAYRLALDGDMDFATYQEAMKKIKDTKLIEMIEGKTRDKRIDVIIDYKIQQERIKGPTTVAQEEGLAETELGKLDPDKWRDQDIAKLLDTTSPYYATKSSATKKMFNGYSDKNRDKVTDNMKGAKYNAGKGLIWP